MPVRTSQRSLKLPTFEYGTSVIVAGDHISDATSLGIANYSASSNDQAWGEADSHGRVSLVFAMKKAMRHRPGSQPRVLRIPGLQIFAIWVPSTDEFSGWVLPFEPIPRFLKATEYDQRDFEAVVRERLAQLGSVDKSRSDDIAP